MQFLTLGLYLNKNLIIMLGKDDSEKQPCKEGVTFLSSVHQLMHKIQNELLLFLHQSCEWEEEESLINVEIIQVTDVFCCCFFWEISEKQGSTRTNKAIMIKMSAVQTNHFFNDTTRFTD